MSYLSTHQSCHIRANALKGPCQAIEYLRDQVRLSRSIIRVSLLVRWHLLWSVTSIGTAYTTRLELSHIQAAGILAPLAHRSWIGNAELAHTVLLGKLAAVNHILHRLALCLAASRTDSLQCHDRHIVALDSGSDTGHTCSSASCQCLQGFLDHRAAGLVLSRRCSPHRTLSSRRNYPTYL